MGRESMNGVSNDVADNRKSTEQPVMDPELAKRIVRGEQPFLDQEWISMRYSQSYEGIDLLTLPLKERMVEARIQYKAGMAIRNQLSSRLKEAAFKTPGLKLDLDEDRGWLSSDVRMIVNGKSSDVMAIASYLEALQRIDK